MNKIIKGKKYDTDTAENINYFQNMSNTDHIDCRYEQLYRKKTGEFFLTIKGYLDMDQYGEGDSSEIIKPLSSDETREWCELHLDGDEYEELFGKVEE